MRRILVYLMAGAFLNCSKVVAFANNYEMKKGKNKIGRGTRAMKRRAIYHRMAYLMLRG